MDIEDYYFDTKNRKDRKLGFTRKAKKNSSKKQNRLRRGAVDGVTKQIREAGAWDTDRINDFCRDVLQDGGLIDTVATLNCYTSGYPFDDTEITLKKEKRWLLCDEIRSAVMQHANDPEMPDVVIIEKAGNTGYGRYAKPDVLRATYSVTAPASDDHSKTKSDDTRLVVVACRKSKNYICQASLDDNMLKASKSCRSESRPKVTYMFRSPNDPYCHPADKIQSCYQARLANTKSSSYKAEIDAYFNDERWDDPADAISDYEEDLIDIDTKSPGNMVFDLNDYIAMAMSKEKRRPTSKSAKATKRKVSEEPGMKKGKVIYLPLSERIGDINTVEQATRSAVSLQISKQTIDEFITKHEIVQSNSVCIANCTPASFTVDLTPPNFNNVKDGFCHLLFETDYDPDLFESTVEGRCNTQITVYASDEKVSREAYERLQSMSTNSSTEDSTEITIEEFIAGVKLSVTELLNAKGAFYQKVQSLDSLNKGTRMFTLCDDLTKKMGMQSTPYSSIDNLRNSVKSPDSEPDADYDFEMVSDLCIGEKCALCGALFTGRDKASGLAIKNCRHWFCKRCWSDHVSHSNDFIHKCLAPECSNAMNFAMKLIACSYRDIPGHHLNGGQFCDGFAYSCPKSSCHRVVKTMFPIDQPSILTCPCGITWCGKCGNEPHWPSSCSTREVQSMEYTAMSLKSSCTRCMKQCPRCMKTLERKSTGRYTNSCPHCHYIYYCWNCVGRCINDFESRMTKAGRYFHWFHRPCKREEVPETKVFTLPGFTTDANTPMEVYESMFKFMKSLRSCEFDNMVCRRASAYFETTSCEEMMSVVTDLLLARNQLCFLTIWIMAEMRYGQSIKSSGRRKYIQGMLKDMESTLVAIDWLLVTKEYDSRDAVFPKAYRLNLTKVNGLLKRVGNAFK